MQTNNTILGTALFNFEQSASRLKLDPAIKQRVMEPKERIELNISPVLPDGKIESFKCFIVRHQDALGPAKGGIRMSPDVDIDDITGLAMEMTWKTSLIGVPFGGGKSGIRLDPSKVSPQEKEIIIRSFIRGATRHIGPEIYIPAPDMGTNEKDMAHIRDCISYSEGISITKGCYVTGKPVILGGIVGRGQATGKGVVYTVLAMCKKLKLDISDMKVVIQGSGNVGFITAEEIVKQGAQGYSHCGYYRRDCQSKRNRYCRTWKTYKGKRRGKRFCRGKRDRKRKNIRSGKRYSCAGGGRLANNKRKRRKYQNAFHRRRCKRTHDSGSR